MGNPVPVAHQIYAQPNALIQYIKLLVPQSSVQFENIPPYFNNLRLVISAIQSGAALDDVVLNFNGDTGANYDWSTVVGNAAATTSGGAMGDTKLIAGLVTHNAIAPKCGSSIIDILSVNSAFAKSVLSRSSANTGAAFLCWEMAGEWNSQATIQGIVCGLAGAGQFEPGSVFTLYGSV